jgi:hypothetical protein
MIPTRYKSRLGKTLAYPVGAEAISLALAGALHSEALELSFHARPVEPASRFQRVLAERLPYTIVAAEYRPARKPGLSAAGSTIEAGYYDQRWELTVYPVLREFRHVANHLLLEQGFPALSRWLRAAEPAAMGIMIRRAVLVFNPADGSLTVNEGGEFESSRV